MVNFKWILLGCFCIGLLYLLPIPITVNEQLFFASHQITIEKTIPELQDSCNNPLVQFPECSIIPSIIDGVWLLSIVLILIGIFSKENSISPAPASPAKPLTKNDPPLMKGVYVFLFDFRISIEKKVRIFRKGLFKWRNSLLVLIKRVSLWICDFLFEPDIP